MLVYVHVQVDLPSISKVDNSREERCGYEIAFDPLDGSSNLDVDVPTG